MREADFQSTVIDTARAFGWRVAHFRPARTADGWRTPVAADASGFPDLVLVRDRVIFAELKTDQGKLSQPQKEWGEAISFACTAWVRDHAMQGTDYDVEPFEFLVWRPADWKVIEAILRPTQRWRQRQPGQPR